MSLALFITMLDETVMVPTEIVNHGLGFLQSDVEYTTPETCSAIFPELVERHHYSRIIFKTTWSTTPNSPSL